MRIPMLAATYDGGRHAPLHDRLIAAAVRRMKLIPSMCDVHKVRDGVHRVTCGHTGSWIEYDTAGWRIRRVSEEVIESED
jgi:hypothetical protein